MVMARRKRRQRQWTTGGTAVLLVRFVSLLLLAVIGIEHQVVQAYTTPAAATPASLSRPEQYCDDSVAAVTNKRTNHVARSKNGGGFIRGVRRQQESMNSQSSNSRLFARPASTSSLSDWEEEQQAEREENQDNNNKKKKTTKKAKTKKGRKKKKKKKKKKAEPKGPASKRLARARAVAIQQASAAADDELSENENDDDDDDDENLGTVTDLMKLIKEQLRANMNRDVSSPVELFRSGDAERFMQQQRQAASITGDDPLSRYDLDDVSENRGNEVAIVFGKPLVDDQVTVEYAERIRTLVQMMKESSSYKPRLICFCGSGNTGDGASNSHGSDADAGLIFFRHLCASQDVSLDNIDIFVDRLSQDEREAIRRATQQIQQRLGKWFEEEAPLLPDVVEETLRGADVGKAEDDDDEYGMNEEYGMIFSRKPQQKLKVHVTLISTEYHLRNFNDIHQRSPAQSFLRPIQAIGEEYELGGDYDDDATGARRSLDDSEYSAFYEMDTYDQEEEADVIFKEQQQREEESSQASSTGRIQGVVESSWSFRSAPYPYIFDEEDEVAFMGKCYLLGEELMPLLVNLKGVVKNVEFFQRENYLVLESIRTTLVSYVEDLYKSPPSQKTGLRLFVVDSSPSSASRHPDVVLEGAVLSLGRCIDLVRPAGLLVSSVPKSDLFKALGSLERCMTEIRSACDPDRPLPPTEWGKMGSSTREE